MPTKRIYLEDASRLETTSRVLAVGRTEDGLSYVRLQSTVFHPQGGGQPADPGFVDDAAVEHVRAGSDGIIDHILREPAQFEAGQDVRLRVDRKRRQLNTRYHTAGHLIAAVGEAALIGARAVSGHHWPGEAYVGFRSAEGISSQNFLEAVRDGISRAVADGLLIAVREPFAVRTVAIGDWLAVPCGGTHLAALEDLGRVRVTRVRVKAGLARISYCVE